MGPIPSKHAITQFLLATKNDDLKKLRENLLAQPIESEEHLKIKLEQLSQPFEGDENPAEKRRLEYIQAQLASFVKVNPQVANNAHFLTALLSLIHLFKESQCNDFYTFIQDELALEQHHPALNAYCLVERLLYPNFHGDHQRLLEAAKANNIAIRSLIPPHLSECDEVISHLKNSPNANFLGALTAYGIGFMPSVLGNIVAARLLKVSPFFRLLISVAPTALGGLARLIIADKSIQGSGKESVMFFLGSSMLGLIAAFALIELVKLEEITVDSFPYALLLCANVISGLGIGGFSAISLALQSAPDEPFESYRGRVQTIVDAKPSQLDKMLASMARAPSKQATSAIAGLGNLTPPATLFIAAGLIPIINLNGYYALISATTVLGIIASSVLVQNSYLDQLRKLNVAEDKARYLAYHLGQRSFLSGDLQGSFLKKFEALTADEWLEIRRAVSNYIVSFGLLLAVGATGNLTFMQRGVPASVVSLYTGSIIAISSLVRANYSINCLKDRPLISTNIAFMGMAITGTVFAMTDLTPSTIFADMMLWAIFNGMANRSIFDELAHNIHHRMGEAVTLAGGIGAWSAFPSSLLFIFASSMNRPNGHEINEVSQTNTSYEYLVVTGLCFLSLLVNAAYHYVLKPAAKETVVQHFEHHTTTVFDNPGITLFSHHANAGYMALEKHKVAVLPDEELDDEELEIQEWDDEAGMQMV